ncbi:TPA: hypothetical protein U2D37_001595 [Streptococcus suis]|nr:hypothetical protein [Streptococcus suis]
MNGPILDILLNLIVLSGLIGVLLLMWILIISMIGLFLKEVKTTPKFRAWDKIRNRISEVERIYIDTKGVRLRDENGEYWRRFDDVILMQSTGLVDKNGKEIFEGDVVEFEDADDIENVYTNRGVVEWCQGGFTVTNRATVSMDDLLDGDKLELEIISNIHANPELVEGVENE